jgi:hypothetical protein
MRRLGDVRPFPARNGRAALLSRTARASGDGSVAQSGCSIAMKLAASWAKVIGEDGLGSMYGDEVFLYKKNDNSNI